jgi:hypothetical protein
MSKQTTQSHISTDMGNLTIEEWQELRKKLTDTKDVDEYWEKAIEFFNYRLHNRYLNPLDSMITNGNSEGEGFSIVTVQCALIEFYAAFRQGMIFKSKNKHNKNNYDTNIYYFLSGEFFQKFIVTHPSFDKYFGTGKTFDDEDFYKNVRCGLAHSCCTRNNWVIRESFKNEAFFIDVDGKKVVNRGQLQIELEAYHETYLTDLRKPNNQELRKFLGRKLDHLCELDADGKYWWTV